KMWRDISAFDGEKPCIIAEQPKPNSNAGVVHVSAEITSVFDLSPSEKLQLLEDLWDDLAAKPDEVPIHEWQKAELVRRTENLKKHPDSVLSWEEVKRRIRSRYGGR
ncbi:MAG TPA: addiction module protein, partial [Pirellulales bacterium]